MAVISDSFNVTTLLGSHLGLTNLLPVEAVSANPQRDFTLNNKYGIAPTEEFSTSPKLKYFGIGIGGCYNADDGILSSAYNPSRANMDLFNPIPVRFRPWDEDLSDSERANYRLRQRVDLNGNTYFAYWLKVLNFDNEVKFKTIDPLTGRENEYQLSSTNLRPKPVKPVGDTTVSTDVSQIVAYCEAKVTLEASEVLEYINAKYGDPRYARISEIGFYTGVDKIITGEGYNSVTVNYTESIYTQLYNHLTNTGIPLTNSGMSIDTTFEITSRGCVVSE